MCYELERRGRAVVINPCWIRILQRAGNFPDSTSGYILRKIAINVHPQGKDSAIRHEENRGFGT
jgi:hypothetical protein